MTIRNTMPMDGVFGLAKRALENVAKWNQSQKIKSALRSDIKNFCDSVTGVHGVSFTLSDDAFEALQMKIFEQTSHSERKSKVTNWADVGDKLEEACKIVANSDPIDEHDAVIFKTLQEYARHIQLHGNVVDAIYVGREKRTPKQFLQTLRIAEDIEDLKKLLEMDNTRILAMESIARICTANRMDELTEVISRLYPTEFRAVGSDMLMRRLKRCDDENYSWVDLAQDIKAMAMDVRPHNFGEVVAKCDAVIAIGYDETTPLNIGGKYHQSPNGYAMCLAGADSAIDFRNRLRKSTGVGVQHNLG